MKLGEALTLRARQAQQLNDLQGRIRASAITQEGTEPPEDVTELIQEYLALSSKHADLVTQIQQTNAAATVKYNGDWTILQLLQDRAELTRQRNLYGVTANAGTVTTRGTFRYTHSELKTIPLVNVAELRAQEEAASEEIRKLDARIQAANWETDLA